MELEELKKSWTHFDKKLDGQRIIDKEVLKQIILNRPEKRLKWMRFQSMLSVIIVPFVLLMVLPGTMKYQDTLVFWLGASILFLFFVYAMLRGFLYYKKLNAINIFKDTIIETRRKIIVVTRFAKWGRDLSIIVIPVLLIGLSFWSGMNFFGTQKLLFTIVFLFVILFLSRIKPKIYILDPLKRVEDELAELEDLKDTDR